MEIEILIKIIILILLILFFTIRSRYTKHYRKFTPRFFVKYLILIVVFVPYLYGYFDFAQFSLNLYTRFILGLAIIFIGAGLFFWTHKHLNRNWSPIIENKFEKSRELIKSGPYKYVRHPIYSLSIIVLIGLLIFSANWLIFLVPFIILIAFYMHKIPKEEQELIRNFGKDYLKYKRSTPAFIPRINLSRNS